MAEETLTADNAAWVRLQGWSVTRSDWFFDPEKAAVYLLAFVLAKICTEEILRMKPSYRLI